MDAPASGVSVGDDGVTRCWWANGDPLLRDDHDAAWGRPVGDDARLFETLMLEAFQSGLSWLTILRKRERFREAFRGFDVDAVSRFDDADVERLMLDAGIVRNRAKIEATVHNARRYPELTDEFGSFAAYAWSFEPKTRPLARTWKEVLARGTEPQAAAMSKDLRRRGWTFVGPTTVQSFMESAGLVNGHLMRCAFGEEVERERARFRRPAPANA